VIVSDSAQKPPNPAENRIRHYADILNPAFWHDSFNRAEVLFEFACTLVRASGMKDTGWESYNESLAFLEDMRRLGDIDLPIETFPQPLHTKARLALVAYSHAIEMKTPYELLANLLRLRVGQKYCIHPFAHLATKRTRKVNGVKTTKIMPASPEKKIMLIEDLSSQARLPEIGKALREIYDPVVRNAVFHSDYVLHGTSMRLLSDYWKSSKKQFREPIIEFSELVSLTANAFGFHSALIALYKRACRSMTDFRDRFLPFDPFYKGILEFTFEGDELTGFRGYWPNGTLSAYCRSIDGQCDAVNLAYNPDGSINFFVGLLASNRSNFSPCVEANVEPIYAEVPGTNKRPYWHECSPSL
jgi:hypothetical protein